MNYKRITLKLKDAETRLTRTLLVKENTNLVILGCIFCNALNTVFEHNFLFIKNKVNYSPDIFIVEALDDGIKEVPMKKYSLKELGNSFKFIYDTGENWVFNCSVSKKVEVIKGGKLAYLVDGKGQGLWEDNKGSLMAYIDGEIDDSYEIDEMSDFSLPWNFNNKKFSDFDNFNLLEAQEKFDESLIESINDYLSMCHGVGLELKVKKIKDPINNKCAKLFNLLGKKVNVEHFVINKTKTDLLSSLENLDKEYAKKYMKENYIDNYKEWKDNVLEMFEVSINESKDDILSINFFSKLVFNENTSNTVFPADDVESNIVFLYRENDELKYYIPDEIKEIITTELKKQNKVYN